MREEEIKEKIDISNLETSINNIFQRNVDLISEVEILRKELQQKENIIKEVREYVNTDKNCIPKHIKDYINNLLNILKGSDKE